MPTYDYECSKCGYEHEQIHSMSGKPDPCPKCHHRKVVKVFTTIPKAKVPDMGWEYEGNGRGRYIPQLAMRPDKTDPNAFCRSRRELMEKATRQGWTIQSR